MIPPVEGSSRECDRKPEKRPQKIYGPLGAVVSQVGEAGSSVPATVEPPQHIGKGWVFKWLASLGCGIVSVLVLAVR